ncbi:Tripartite-type tricarboxylate transporter, receptor component TctC [Falsiroseomonas stagni DSM 19981]|uniref:Tripartite-type tricarboxylate transporter, receptor component TctC n=1 Tax=Falsiroseomonas stagni DSM 19981 TaxID=1123062 RepID=A0A1I4BR44_9PROT|nr:Tripartite-type tricarboxylate transporter, receptor component TctC [Falsiroseomonas stagni DSM 19981]
MPSKPTPLARRLVLLSMVAAPSLALAQAQPWPTRAVRIIVPFPAGAGTDTLARAYAQRLSELWGQPVVVENRAGAAGIIGTEAAFRAPRDGYTILMANSSVLAIGPAINPTLPYDPVGGFDPVALVGSNDNALVVRAQSPFQTVADVVAAARARPGVLTYATPGTGTSGHMAGEFFKQLAGIDITHVPYRGSPQALTDTLGGQVDMTMTTLNSIVAAVRNGQARALATTGRTRDPLLPEVATFAELGFAGYEASGWLGFVVPAGTPAEITRKIAADIRRIYDDATFTARIASQGMRPIISTPEEFRAILAPELARWREVAQRAGVKPE